jgi:hypothetical protein
MRYVVSAAGDAPDQLGLNVRFNQPPAVLRIPAGVF